MKKLLHLSILLLVVLTISCRREPPLYLYEAGDVDLELPDIEVGLEAYWDYELIYGVEYDWEAEWYYGWDENDEKTFGTIGYTEPTAFNLRRYYLGNQPNVPHTSKYEDLIYDRYFHSKFAWGFWDILVWNDISTIDGVQSLNFDETSLDSVIAYTNQSMNSSRYQAPRYTRSFYQPEPLFSVYEQAIEISESLEGFEFDATRNVWVKKLNMVMRPITYIYLTQVILHHNNGRVVNVDGVCNLSAMARTTNLNTGAGGNDAVTVTYNSLFKPNCNKNGESVDIIGGRLMTFGICNLAANKVTKLEDVKDSHRHYIDVTMNFSNGMDSTFVFNVTDQVRKRFKGGVLTVELDMDTIPTPSRKGGSAFDAVVEDYEDGGTHEFEM